jgi:hypothetical protein
MAAWSIGVQIVGSKIDSAGLVRLVEFFEREFPDYEPDCTMWSGRLAISATVRSPSSPEALESILKAINLALDETGIDVERLSEITSMTLRPASPTPAVPDALPQALLRRVSFHHQRRLI